MGSPTNHPGSRQRQDTGQGSFGPFKGGLPKNLKKKNGPHTGSVLLRQGEADTSQYIWELTFFIRTVYGGRLDHQMLEPLTAPGQTPTGIGQQMNGEVSYLVAVLKPTPDFFFIFPTLHDIINHWRCSLNKNRQGDCRDVHDEVLCISSWLHQLSKHAVRTTAYRENLTPSHGF